MLGRLLIGILKGVIVGGLVGFGLAKIGMVAFAPSLVVVAYLAAAATGVLVGLIAGKPIWAKDAKVEASMKAVVGALLACGLMYAARRWLTMPLPFSLGPLSIDPSITENGDGAVVGAAGAVGHLAITSLAAVGAVLGGFYDADNTPGTSASEPAKKLSAPEQKKRIAEAEVEDDDEDLDQEHAEKKPSRAKR